METSPWLASSVGPVNLRSLGPEESRVPLRVTVANNTRVLPVASRSSWRCVGGYGDESGPEAAPQPHGTSELGRWPRFESGKGTFRAGRGNPPTKRTKTIGSLVTSRENITTGPGLLFKDICPPNDLLSHAHRDFLTQGSITSFQAPGTMAEGVHRTWAGACSSACERV